MLVSLMISLYGNIWQPNWNYVNRIFSDKYFLGGFLATGLTKPLCCLHCTAGRIMGKPSRQRRNRLRMTLFNLAKSNQHNTIQQNTIENLYVQISSLKTEINVLNEKLSTANDIIPFANVNEATSDNITNNQVSNLSLFPTPIQDVSPIKLKQDLLESKQANLDPDQNIDGPLTADVFYKYMKDHFDNMKDHFDITWYFCTVYSIIIHLSFVLIDIIIIIYCIVFLEIRKSNNGCFSL